MIPSKTGYNGCPITHFLASGDPWNGISSVEGTGSFHPRLRDQVDSSSTVVAEDGRSLLSHIPRQVMSGRTSGGSTSSIPTLTSDNRSFRSVSDLSSTQCNWQMYNLPSDSSGGFYTHRPNVAQPVSPHAAASKEGMYPCIFAFVGCTTFCALETWESHVNTHLLDADPPESCTCTICDQEFKSGISGEELELGARKATWSRFLNHVLSHKYRGAFNPNSEFSEFCRDKNIISDFTIQRFDQNPTTRPQYRERERRTPRRPANTASINPPDTAQVEYRSSWGENTAVMQQAIERDIVVNRGNSRAHRERRA